MPCSRDRGREEETKRREARLKWNNEINNFVHHFDRFCVQWLCHVRQHFSVVMCTTLCSWLDLDDVAWLKVGSQCKLVWIDLQY